MPLTTMRGKPLQAEAAFECAFVDASGKKINWFSWLETCSHKGFAGFVEIDFLVGFHPDKAPWRQFRRKQGCKLLINEAVFALSPFEPRIWKEDNKSINFSVGEDGIHGPGVAQNRGDVGMALANGAFCGGHNPFKGDVHSNKISIVVVFSHLIQRQTQMAANFHNQLSV